MIQLQHTQRSDWQSGESSHDGCQHSTNALVSPQVQAQAKLSRGVEPTQAAGHIQQAWATQTMVLARMSKLTLCSRSVRWR